MKIIFLDRDGVINRYPGRKKYVTKLREFHFLPGSLEAIKKLSQAKFNIFVISNQAGVNKGIFTKNKLQHITKNMLEKIRLGKGRIRSVLYCIHQEADNCSCRKPKLGLIEKALRILGNKKITKKNAFFVGDSILDMATGKNAGCSTMLVLSGKERQHNKRNWKVKPDYIVKDLLTASKIILNENFDYPCLSRSRTQTRC
ncbi:MAG: HAD-IIIA family hydrolase [Candidatus Omnitrophota bacterium]|nr:HAD-IIIA family hydrolase [Candidatus Omnitrophota bacterium]